MSVMVYWSGVACALAVAAVENNYTILVPLVMGILPRTLDSIKQFWPYFSNDTEHGDVDKSKDEINGIKCKDHDRHKCADDFKSRDDCECKDYHKCQDDWHCKDNFKCKDGSKYRDYNHGSKLQEEYKLTDHGLDLSMWTKFEDMCKPKGECSNGVKNDAILDDEIMEEYDHMDKLDDKSKEECTDDIKLNDEFKVTEECNDCSNWAELKSKTDRVNLYNENKLECEDRVKLYDENKKECDDMDRLDDENKEECNGEYKVTEECNDCCTWTDSKEEGSYEWSELDGAMLYDFIKNKMECDDVVKWDDKTREDCGYLVKLDDENKVESNDLTKLNDGWNVTEEYNDCSTWAEPKEEPNSELSKIEESNLDKESKLDCENRFKLDNENRNECNCKGKLDDENKDKCNDGAKLEDECKVTEECNDCSTWANLKEECKDDDITDRN